MTLSVAQQQQYSAAPQAFKDKVDNYFKDKHGELLKTEIDKLNREHDIKSLGEHYIFQDVDDCVKNIGVLFSDDTIGNGKRTAT